MSKVKPVQPKPGPKIRHKKCGDVIQSKHVHDFVWCRCGQLAVDGGGEYLKMCGDFKHAEEVKDES